VVAVDADTEIDLVGRFVATEGGVYAKDWIGWQTLDGVEHATRLGVFHRAAAPAP
jgi:hypothetical protein